MQKNKTETRALIDEKKQRLKEFKTISTDLNPKIEMAEARLPECMTLRTTEFEELRSRISKLKSLRKTAEEAITSLEKEIDQLSLLETLQEEAEK